MSVLSSEPLHQYNKMSRGLDHLHKQLSMILRACLRRFSNGVDNRVPELAEGILSGDRVSLSRGITLGILGFELFFFIFIVESALESDAQDAAALMRILYSHNKTKSSEKDCMRLGFTGAPGVGKSSLIETLGLYIVEEKKSKLAVLVPEDYEELYLFLFSDNRSQLNTQWRIHSRRQD